MNSLPDKMNGRPVRVHCDSGSVENVRGVVSGKVEIGIAQSAVLYEAVNGIGEWAQYGKMRNLRSICTLFSKSLTIVARESSGIKTATDLDGKRVNIGEPGTGTNANARQLLSFIEGHAGKKPGAVLELSNEEALAQFREKKIDAVITNLTHPNTYIQELLKAGGPARFVDIASIRDFVQLYPYYVEDTLPAKCYPEAADNRDLKVIATPTILFTHEGIQDKAVDQLLSEIILNLYEIKHDNPELASLQAESLLADSVLPAHEGALSAFFRAGIVRVKPTMMRSPLMAVTYDHRSPVSASLAGALCKEVNGRRINGLRMVLLATDNDRDNIYRVISGNSHIGLANAAELYNAWNGMGSWKTIGAMKNLAALARIYDQAILAVVPRAGETSLDKLNLVLMDTDDGGRTEAIEDLLEDMYPGEKRISVKQPAEAAAAFLAGNTALVLPTEISPGEIDAGSPAWLSRVQHMLATLNVEGNLVPVKPDAKALAANPWFGSTPVCLGDAGGALETASLPMMLFSCSQIPPQRLIPALDSLLACVVKDEGKAYNMGYINYLAQKSPIIFHEAVDLFMADMAKGHAEIKSIKPGHLPEQATNDITIAAKQSAGGGFLSAGTLSFVLTKSDESGNFITFGMPVQSEEEAIHEVEMRHAHLAIVPATILHEAINGKGRWEGRQARNVRVVGSLYTVPLGFFADSNSVKGENITLRHFAGKRVSAPGTGERDAQRGKGISILNIDKFFDSLSNRSLINTEESGLREAIQMYNKGVISGFFVTTIHPSAELIEQVSPQRPGRFIPIQEGYDFVVTTPYYVNTALTSQLLARYPKTMRGEGSVPTIGVPMMLITHDGIANDIIERIMKLMASAMPAIREMHPSFASFDAAAMLSGTSVATVHPGALAYYEEQGLIARPGTEGMQQTLSMGTGPQNGSFFVVGGFLERVINASLQDGTARYRVAMEASEGSHENCLAIHDKAYDLAITQADLAYKAYMGKAEWSEKPFKDLRAICNLHNIPLMLVVRSSVAATSLDQLNGLTINVGSPGSGTRVMANLLLDMPNLGLREKIKIKGDPDQVAIDKLFSGGVDGIFISIGYSETLDRLLNAQGKTRLIPLDTQDISNLAESSGMVLFTLPKKLFPGLQHDTVTLATRATLIVNENMPVDQVKDVLKAVISWRNRISPMPTLLQDIDNQHLASDITIPLHPGAIEAFREADIALPAGIPETNGNGSASQSKAGQGNGGATGGGGK